MFENIRSTAADALNGVDSLVGEARAFASNEKNRRLLLWGGIVAALIALFLWKRKSRQSAGQ